MPSALGLYEAGIQFKVSDTGGHFDNGVLSIPRITVDDYTEKLLVNLMAFERLHVGAGNDVTAYVFFMDSIVDTARDVELLRSKKIIDSLLGSNQEVANLFNSLAKDAALDGSSALNGAERQLNDYCRKRRHKWRASFVNTYLRNPWVFISLVAAAILLVATFLQTVYTIVPFYNSKC